MGNDRLQKPFFPVFLDLSEKCVIVAGGGSIAERRIRTLRGFVGRIRIIAPEIRGGIRELLSPDGQAGFSEGGTAVITWAAKRYDRRDLQDADLVLACTDDPERNREIYRDCRDLGIPVNDCSDKRNCDFYFPGIVQKDGIVIGINGSGADHHRVKAVRQEIETTLGCRHSLYPDHPGTADGRTNYEGMAERRDEEAKSYHREP